MSHISLEVLSRQDLEKYLGVIKQREMKLNTRNDVVGDCRLQSAHGWLGAVCAATHLKVTSAALQPNARCVIIHVKL